jgi:hypothetical protein
MISAPMKRSSPRMSSFMMEIDAAQRSPLDQLAVDYLTLRSTCSLDFCCRTVGVPENDDVVARRLGVGVTTVRRWREVGRRVNGRSGKTWR